MYKGYLCGLVLLFLCLFIYPVVKAGSVSAQIVSVNHQEIVPTPAAIHTGRFQQHRTACGGLLRASDKMDNTKAHISSPQKPTKDGCVLLVIRLGIVSHHGAKVEVVHRLLVLHHEGAPPLLAGLALHLILVDCGSGVELGKGLLEVLVDFVVDLGESQT